MAIEVLYYRHFWQHVEECETVEEALAFIETGEDEGRMSSVGVFVDGKPHIYDGYVAQDPPTEKQAADMARLYAEAKA